MRYYKLFPHTFTIRSELRYELDRDSRKGGISGVHLHPPVIFTIDSWCQWRLRKYVTFFVRVSVCVHIAPNDRWVTYCGCSFFEL